MWLNYNQEGKRYEKNSNIIRIAAVDGYRFENGCSKSLINSYNRIVSRDQESGATEQIFWDYYLDYQLNHYNGPPASRPINDNSFVAELTASEQAYLQTNLSLWRALSTYNSEGAAKTVGEASNPDTTTQKAQIRLEIADYTEEDNRALRLIYHRMRAFQSISPSHVTSQPISDYFIILKDDAVFNPEIFHDNGSSKSLFTSFSQRVHQIMSNPPADWDIIILGGYTPTVTKKAYSNQSTSNDPYRYKELPVKGHFVKINYVNVIYGYAISPKAAQRILKDFLPINKPFDQFIAELLFREELQVSPSNQICLIAPSLSVFVRSIGVHSEGKISYFAEER